VIERYIAELFQSYKCDRNWLIQINSKIQVL